jgi:hypothetical protein
MVANWVDVFTADACAGALPDAWPEVLVIDSAEMRVKSGPRRGQGFHVIAAVGKNPAPSGELAEPLRLWRLAASPTKDTAAYETFCCALPGRPRVVITDMDQAARSGIARAFADDNGEIPELRMGEWHLHRSLRGRLPDSLAADASNPVMQRIGLAFREPERWQRFVDAVEQEHAAGTHGPLHLLLRWIDDYGAIVEAQAATRDRGIPNSTSPVEASLQQVVRRLRDRAGVFTNLARMNKLLALITLDLRGQADGREWADRVRDRTYQVGGHAGHQRPHDDRRGHCSLTA